MLKPFLFIFLLLPLHLSGLQNLSGVKTGMTGTMRGLHAVSDKVIWISGTKGEFAVTRDAGKTWYQQAVPGAEKLDFRDVHGFSGDIALLMSIGPGSASKIFRTTDGGKSWNMTFENRDSLAFFDGMDFFDEKHGMIISDPADNKPYILETLDGGLTWNRLQPKTVPELVKGEYAFAASGTSLDARPGGECWLATGGTIARAFKTDDYGANWTAVKLPLLQGDAASGAFSIAKGPGKSVAACGGHYQQTKKSGSNIVISSDNGITWRVPAGASSVPFMECIRWIGRKTLVACGPPGVWISEDSGTTWKEISKEGFHTCDVVPGKKVVWLAGNQGNVATFTL
jgi:photosystem II stability/assembly factor-like uncharacterized protein